MKNFSRIKKNGKVNFVYNRCKSTWLNDDGFCHIGKGVRKDYESLYISMVIALSCLEIGGTLAKYIHHQLSLNYLHILQKYFKMINFMKLPTSFKYQPHSYWIICTGYNGIDIGELKTLENLWKSGNFVNTQFNFNSSFIDEKKRYALFKKQVQLIHNHKYNIVMQLQYVLDKLSQTKGEKRKIKIKKLIRSEQMRYAFDFL